MFGLFGQTRQERELNRLVERAIGAASPIEERLAELKSLARRNDPRGENILLRLLEDLASTIESGFAMASALGNAEPAPAMSISESLNIVNFLSARELILKAACEMPRQRFVPLLTRIEAVLPDPYVIHALIVCRNAASELNEISSEPDRTISEAPPSPELSGAPGSGTFKRIGSKTLKKVFGRR